MRGSAATGSNDGWFPTPHYITTRLSDGGGGGEENTSPPLHLMFEYEYTVCTASKTYKKVLTH